MFIFDPRPVTNGNFITWSFICEWCGNYYPSFFITRDNKKTFKCSCGNHPTSKYNSINTIDKLSTLK